MKRFNFTKPLVESKYPPQDTNVLWVDVDESTGKVTNIKKFLRGEWPDIIIELYFLTLLCKNKKTKAIVEDFWVDPLYNVKSANMGFVHLGAAKPGYQKILNRDLSKENPLLWEECVKKLQLYDINI